MRSDAQLMPSHQVRVYCSSEGKFIREAKNEKLKV